MKNLFIILIFFILLLQNYLQGIIPIFQYTDEIIAMSLSLFYFTNVIRTKEIRGLTRYELKQVGFIILYLLTGFAGNFIFKMQPSYKAIFSDAFLSCKFILVYIGAYILTRNTNYTRTIVYIEKISKVFTNIMAVCLILDYFNILNMHSEIRFGFHVYNFIFGHSTFMISTCIILLSIFVLNNENNRNTRYIIVILIIILSGMRMKAFGFIGAFIALNLLMKFKRKISFRSIIAIGIVSILIGRNQLGNLLSHPEYARSALYIHGLKSMISHFPIGTGFGSFASYYSGVSYSNAYYQYGIDNIYGITADYYSYIADTFWPNVCGQVGAIGLFLFIKIIIAMYNNIKIKTIGVNQKIAALSILIYFIIASTGESSFFNYYGIAMMFTLNLILNINSHNVRRKSIETDD